MAQDLTSDNAQAAIAAIPGHADWVFAPAQHASGLPPAAGALKRVLEREEVGQIQTAFVAADAAAIAAQRRYKTIGRTGLYTATIATLAGALFILPLEDWHTSTVGTVVSSLQILALVIAFLTTRALALRHSFGRWMTERARAEIARIDLFDTLAKHCEAPKDGELTYLPLMLAYFVRFQLEVQRQYYRGRGNQHEAAQYRNNRWLTVSIAITLFSIALAVLGALHLAPRLGFELPPWLEPWSRQAASGDGHRIILALGVVASSLYALGTARSLMDLDDRNASRYLTTAENLDYLADTALSGARDAATRGDGPAVTEFVQQVQSQISTEHREWLLLRERVRL